MDLQGLQKQIDEKKTREEEEKKIDEAYRLKQTTDAEIAKRLERNIEEVLLLKVVIHNHGIKVVNYTKLFYHSRKT